MKTLFTTAALSFFTLINVAEAQNEKQTLEARLMESFPTTDNHVETPRFWVNIEKLWASLPTFDENVEVPTQNVNIAQLMASLPTMDYHVEVPVLKVETPTPYQTTATRVSED
ncbi:MAG: hypothetical protein MUE30_00130 [Spirosomaceae bacterium]|nr:hypothetical protein [Spirosomataceae bacterium]